MKINQEPAGVSAVATAGAALLTAVTGVPAEVAVPFVAGVAALGAWLVRQRTTTHAWIDNMIEIAEDTFGPIDGQLQQLGLFGANEDDDAEA